MEAVLKGGARVELTSDARIITPGEIKTLLEPGEFGCMLDWEVKDPKTSLITAKNSKRSESFVRQFIEMLYLLMTQRGTNYGYLAGIRDIYGRPRIGLAMSRTFECVAAAGDITKGIVIGTGTDVATINDYRLQTIVPSGTGSGQVQYSAVIFGSPAYDSTTSQFTITRNFANASGGLIIATEIGLYTLLLRTDHGNSDIDYLAMTIRDVIPGGISIPDGQTLTVNYRPQAVI